MSPFCRISELSNRMLRLLVEEDFESPVFVVMVSKNNAMQFAKVTSSEGTTYFDTEFTRWIDSEDGRIQFPVRIILFDEIGKAVTMDVELSELIDFRSN